LDEFDLHKEPEFEFSSLTAEKYCELYDYEMASFKNDLPFYLCHTEPGSNTLELGCGTGRLTRELARNDQQLTAIDINFSMVHRAAAFSSGDIHYICADMTEFFVLRQFDSIVIPYNTLNLLADIRQVERCLSCCGETLRPEGKLLIHLFVPDMVLKKAADTRLFQFQIITVNETTSIIKEIIKKYVPSRKILLLEERYRIRTTLQETILREDYSRTSTLVAIDHHDWFQHIEKAGFTIKRLYGNYQLTEHVANENSHLMVVASKN